MHEKKGTIVVTNIRFNLGNMLTMYHISSSTAVCYQTINYMFANRVLVI